MASVKDLAQVLLAGSCEPTVKSTSLLGALVVLRVTLSLVAIPSVSTMVIVAVAFALVLTLLDWKVVVIEPLIKGPCEIGTVSRVVAVF